MKQKNTKGGKNERKKEICSYCGHLNVQKKEGGQRISVSV